MHVYKFLQMSLRYFVGLSYVLLLLLLVLFNVVIKEQGTSCIKCAAQNTWNYSSLQNNFNLIVLFVKLFKLTTHHFKHDNIRHTQIWTITHNHTHCTHVHTSVVIHNTKLIRLIFKIMSLNWWIILFASSLPMPFSSSNAAYVCCAYLQYYKS